MGTRGVVGSRIGEGESCRCFTPRFRASLVCVRTTIVARRALFGSIPFSAGRRDSSLSFRVRRWRGRHGNRGRTSSSRREPTRANRTSLTGGLNCRVAMRTRRAVDVHVVSPFEDPDFFSLRGEDP